MDPNEFDWDRFEAEGRELELRMREVADRNARAVAESRAARARYEHRGGGESLVREGVPPAGRGRLHQRLDRFELTLTRFELTLARMEQDLSTVKRDLMDVKQEVVQIREQMATKVELESLRHDINLVADGFAQTQNRLSETTNLLKRCLTSA